MTQMPITFVVAVNNHEVLGRNVLASPCLKRPHPHELIIQEYFSSAAQAYNDALSRASHEIVVLLHQDVFLPASWLAQFNTALEMLAKTDPSWGVLGCWGLDHSGKRFGHVYTPGQGVIGHAFREPVRIQTLDELILITRKSSRLRFDPQLPGFHLYGTDVCLAAASAGLNCYAISAFCLHNAQQYFKPPADFKPSYRHVKHAWRNFLPIYTSCVTITKLDYDLHKQYLQGAILRVLKRQPERGPRVENPRLILAELERDRQVSLQG